MDQSALLRGCFGPAVQDSFGEADIPISGSSPSDTQLLALIEGITSVVTTVATAMENGEYDFDGTRKAKVRFAFVTSYCRLCVVMSDYTFLGYGTHTTACYRIPPGSE